jgi:hypothetical protein
MIAAIDILQSLGSYIGLKGLLPSGETSCAIVFDDKIVVSFIASNPDMINAISVVGELNPENEMPVMRDALARNFQPRPGAQFVLSIDTGSNALVLISRWDATGLKLDAFYKDIEAFVETVEACQIFLEGGYKEKLSKRADGNEGFDGPLIRG